MIFNIRDCNKCKYVGKCKENYICTKQDKRLYYRGMKPILPAYLNNCPIMNYRERELSQQIRKEYIDKVNKEGLYE